MKYFSMFAGIGGFEYGIEKAYSYKYEPQKPKQTNSKSRRKRNTNEQNHCVLSTNDSPLGIGYSEIDKYAIQIYRKHYKGHKNYGDAKTIITDELPEFDLLVGGFPCQAFSIAGKRGGFNDTRGTLFFEIARILRDKRPRHFVLENVKGLLSHEEGKTFQTILGVLTDLGYRIEWQVLNSKHFGVPQNRERVFIVGHLAGECSGKVFPVGESNQEFVEQNGQGNDIAHTVQPGDKHRGSYILDDYNQNIKDDGIVPAVRRTNASSAPRNASKIVEGMQIRRLTPIECERLQGFPDNWTEYGIDTDSNKVKISDTQRYKCLGNAVTTNVITAIMKRLT